MKKIIILLLSLAGTGIASVATAQNSPKTQQDTSKAWKQKYEPVAVPDPAVTGPQRTTDTSGVYNNRVYQNGIRSAEYQNRGAEDRRDATSSDPKAIPNQQVPAKEVLPPKTVK